MITVACVWVGNKYPVEYVEKLARMVARHLSRPHRFVCLTDNDAVVAGVEFVNIAELGLREWWAKMALFSPEIRGAGRCVYLDLDTVIVGSIDPLADYSGEFAICENFTRLAGNKGWPCAYGSCVMVLPDGWGADLFERFMRNRNNYIATCPRGDQQAIEKLHPNAVYLQAVLPAGFFVNRREFTDEIPKGAALMIFAGKKKPHTERHKWIGEAWV